jgi:hypothetical protein
MDTSTPLPLTAKHIDSHPTGKLDKGRLIDLYIQGQKPYARIFADEGKALTRTWNDNTPRRETPGVVIQVETHGFETPVLKPRVSQPRPKAPEIKVPPAIEERHDQPVARRNKSKTTRPHSPAELPKSRSVNGKRSLPMSGDASNDKRAVAPNVRAKPSKKRIRQGSSDNDDKIARSSFTRLYFVMLPFASSTGMTERRERKRVKRAIVRPDNSESDHDGGSVISQGKTTKKAKGKKGMKQTLFSGLAFMHGFSATNVGKNRLTVSNNICLKR